MYCFVCIRWINDCSVKGFIYLKYKPIIWSCYRLYPDGEVYHEDEFEELDNSLSYYGDYFEFKLPDNKFIFEHIDELKCSNIDKAIIVEYISVLIKG